MKTTPVLLLLVALSWLAGCATRSISDSGYRGDYRYGSRGSSNPFYKGELTELDILGAAPKSEATDVIIQKALSSDLTPRPKRGDRVLLIQSGALVPDAAMIEEARRYFELAPFSGVPPAEKDGLAQSLRLHAARGGYRFVLCYWGVLESAVEAKEGRVLSWVPIAGSFVPDEKQQMRIRLKAVLLDVGTGGWTMLTPEVHSDSKISSRLQRESSDQKQVEALKTAGYRSLVASLLR